MKTIVRCWLLIFGLVVLTATSFKPIDDTFKITLKIDGPDLGSQYWLYTITGNKSAVRIRHLFADTIRYADLWKDPDYPIEYKGGKGDLLTSAQAQLLQPKLDSLSMNYRRHIETVNGTTKEKSPTYFAQIDSVLHADKDVLTPTDKRLFLDGMLHHIYIQVDGKTRDYYFKSPNEKSHPLIYRFMQATNNFLFVKRK